MPQSKRAGLPCRRRPGRFSDIGKPQVRGLGSSFGGCFVLDRGASGVHPAEAHPVEATGDARTRKAGRAGSSFDGGTGPCLRSHGEHRGKHRRPCRPRPNRFSDTKSPNGFHLRGGFVAGPETAVLHPDFYPEPNCRYASSTMRPFARRRPARVHSTVLPVACSHA